MPPLNRFPLIAPFLVATALGGCAVGPDFATPAAPDVPSFAMKGDKAPDTVKLTTGAPAGPWWTALSSPLLDTTIRNALTQSPTLDEADATLLQAKAGLAAAKGQSLPQVDLTGGVQRERVNLNAFGFTGFGSGPTTNPTFTLYSLGTGVSYDLDLFGRNRRGIEAAEARAEAQGWRTEAAYLTLTSNVAIQAITIAALRAEIAAVEANIADDQQTVDLITRAAKLGGSTEAARLSTVTQLEKDRALLPSLQGQLAEARHALGLLSGEAPGGWTPPDFAMSGFKVGAAIPIGVPSELVRRRPDIRAAEADLHAATAEIGVATANMYPNITISASITQGSLAAGNLFSYDSSAWALGSALTAPIFHGGTLEAERQAAIAAAQATDARYRQTVLKAFTEVADALSAIATDEATITAQRATEAHAAESLRLSRVAFQEGGGTLLDVLQAQRDRNEATAARVRAEGQRLADIVRLFAAVGADWRDAAPRQPGA
ncbi:MAG: efflux transporter outer membrane subunit [Alphaproteobacteria bacterium]|nr:efflux transporter outer membrane subunit [Alphaproteobacteria bacterium]